MNRRVPDCSANPLVREIGKDPADFTRQDILAFIRRRGIRTLHFRYPALDGKLKELKLPVNDLRDAEAVLAEGERVDGSSLFKGMVDAGRSDMYVLPLYRSAFLNPFAPDGLEFVCRFLDAHGEPAAQTPDNVLARADETFRKRTGRELHALGELEFYVLHPAERELYPGRPQGAYHEAAPYSRWDALAAEALRLTSEICGGVKYCHAEVGHVEPSEDSLPRLRGMSMSQYELEFLPAPLDATAGRLLVAKWIIRSLAARQGLLVSFAPKLSMGDAGSGLHFHLSLLRGGRNALIDRRGTLTEDARALIGGLLAHAGSLTAFGNTCAASYLRLVPHQEAPVRVCWSSANRSALVRVPLAWRGVNNLASRVNPRQMRDYRGEMFGQTVELRSPDGSADVHLLLAGISCAVREGLTDRRASLERTRAGEVAGNIYADPKVLRRLETLPGSCAESARRLERDRAVYARDDVFPAPVLDYCIRRLQGEDDAALSRKLGRMSKGAKRAALDRIVSDSLHCM